VISVTVLVVIPAHDEAAGIAATIESVRRQTLRPTGVIVVADNCTDDTARIAIQAGAEVFTTAGNTHKKAGALNQFLAERLPALDADDVVLVMDADTRLSRRFLDLAVGLLRSHCELGAVGGVFAGAEPHGWLEHCQANEYARYSRDVARHGGRVMVLTGTASAFRVSAMRDVAAARGERVPGQPGAVYDVASLTEDNEITLALKHLGHRLVSPRGCVVWTELMPTIADLHRQRLRWYRGALDNLRSYGWTKVTARYWLQQGSLALSVAVLALLTLLTSVAVATGTLRFSGWWSLIGVGFLVERVVSAWRTGSRYGRLLSALLLPELVYDLLLQATFLRSVTHSLRRTDAEWHHVSPTPVTRPSPAHTAGHPARHTARHTACHTARPAPQPTRSRTTPVKEPA
jgi:cellulose synthase/poly-beta-1,6-N-acetylglucosamine synthase-like glycosyltransferase